MADGQPNPCHHIPDVRNTEYHHHAPITIWVTVSLVCYYRMSDSVTRVLRSPWVKLSQALQYHDIVPSVTP